MNLFVTLRVALRALVRNKLRSFLTVLGIIIGVAAVIAMVAIGEGAKARVRATFDSMGSNLLIVHSGSSRSGGMRGGSGSAPTITWNDLTAIRNELSTVKLAAPQLTTRVQVVAEEQNWSTTVTGTTPDYLAIRAWPLSSGAAFTTADVEAGTKVALAGQTVVDSLFGPNADAIGQIIRIRNVPFTIVGVLAKKGQSAFGQDWDDSVLVPVTTFQAKLERSVGQYIPGAIVISATSQADTARAQKQIGALLRDRHRIAAGAEDDFTVRNLSEIASAQQESTKTFTTLLAAIAAVSLLVGGIGIMNIMLVSVTERTREIGVRMAVGAKPSNIMAQFLVESVTLSVIGGLVGVALGVLGGRKLAAEFDWPMIIRADIIIVAVVFAAVVGIGFGLYPAHKASRLDPIQALRFE